MTDRQAKEMRGSLDPHIRTVGVFVNEEIERVIRLCQRQIIDLIQLHGDEDGAYLERLSAHTDKPIVRAVRVQSAAQILSVQEQPCDYLLMDTYIPGQ